MKKLAIVALAGLMALAGCANLSSAYHAIADATVSPQLVLVAANAFDAVEATAKNVIVACTPATRPAACNDTVIRSLIPAVKAGRDARDGLEGFLVAHPGQLGSKGLYDALVAATGTITKAIADFNGSVSP